MTKSSIKHHMLRSSRHTCLDTTIWGLIMRCPENWGLNTPQLWVCVNDPCMRQCVPEYGVEEARDLRDAGGDVDTDDRT